MKNWTYISYKDGLDDKAYNLEDLLNKLPRPIVFTNGVFDILHLGHIKYLINSKNLGSSLIVGINSNSSTKRLGKGTDRPINDEIDRALIVSSLKSVDFCIIFDDSTPEKLIKIIKPNIYTKGEDYDKCSIPYLSTLEKLDIKIYFLPFIKGKSTTMIIDKINGRDS